MKILKSGNKIYFQRRIKKMSEVTLTYCETCERYRKHTELKRTALDVPVGQYYVEYKCWECGTEHETVEKEIDIEDIIGES
jgi:hypothetical protein